MTLTKHQKKLEKIKRREEERRKVREEYSAKKRRNKTVKYSIGLLILILILWWTYSILSGIESEGPYTKSAVHWHADITVDACGIRQQLPRPIGPEHLGTPLLHTHNDGKVHIEGKIWNKEDITLGRYLDVIGVEFDRNRIMDFENGNMCNDGKENKVRIFVNEKENNEFRDYAIQDNDNIRIVYE